VDLQLKNFTIFVFLELAFEKFRIVLVLPRRFVFFSELYLRHYSIVMLRSHELRVRILCELIREVNLAKSTEREDGASSLSLEKATEKKTCILWRAHSRIHSVAERNEALPFPTNFETYRYCKNTKRRPHVRPTDTRIFAAPLERRHRREGRSFSPSPPRVKIHACSRVCRVRSKCTLLKAVFSESPNRTKMLEEKGSWIYIYMIVEFILLLCIFFFARSATRSRSFQLHPVYVRYIYVPGVLY